MFCDGCGKELQPGQQFCSACGKSAVSAVPETFRYKSKVARHSHILGILWLVYSAFTLIGACVLFVLALTIFGPGSRIQPTPEIPGGLGFLHLLFIFLGFLVLFKAMAALAIGVGLLQYQPWARPLALVVAFLALLNVPFGTALGIYTIWILMSPNAADEYQRLSATANPNG